MKNDAFIATRSAARFRELVAMLDDYAQGKPGLGVVYGASGFGKTLSARRLQAERGGVFYRVWEGMSQFAMLEGLAFEVCGTWARSANAAKRAIINELSTTPQTIYVDEADRLPVPRIEDLRDIHDETGASIILIGEEQMWSKLSSLARLWGRVLQQVEFVGATDQEVLMLATQATGLQVAPAAAVALQVAAKGSLRRVAYYLIQLEKAARAQQTRTVDADLAQAVVETSTLNQPVHRPRPAGRR